jgi:hypothetical protein
MVINLTCNPILELYKLRPAPSHMSYMIVLIFHNFGWDHKIYLP